MTAKEMGRKGGKARMSALTKKQRTALATKAAKAMWANWRKRKATR